MVKKKTFTHGDDSLQVKVLLFSKRLSPGPGVATVLTNQRSAISPADSYSPLHAVNNNDAQLPCQPISSIFVNGAVSLQSVNLSLFCYTIDPGVSPGISDLIVHREPDMTRAATSVMRYARFLALAGVRRVLDYGAGLLRNSLYLAENGFEVYAADLPERVKALSMHPGAARLAGLLSVRDLSQSELGVDLVLSTYVFNIIPSREKRGQYLDNVVRNLRPGGFFLIEVNSGSDETPCTSVLHHYPECDGKGKSYQSRDLDRLLIPLNFGRICHYHSSHALAAIYRRR